MTFYFDVVLDVLMMPPLTCSVVQGTDSDIMATPFIMAQSVGRSSAVATSCALEMNMRRSSSDALCIAAAEKDVDLDARDVANRVVVRTARFVHEHCAPGRRRPHRRPTSALALRGRSALEPIVAAASLQRVERSVPGSAPKTCLSSHVGWGSISCGTWACIISFELVNTGA